MGRTADDEAFEAFVHERSRSLLRYGFLLAGDPHTAADLVQEALLRLRQAWDRDRGREHPEAYVRRLADRPAATGQRVVADRFVVSLTVDGKERLYDAEAGKYLTLPGPAADETWDRGQVNGGWGTNPFATWTTEKGDIRILQLGAMR